MERTLTTVRDINRACFENVNARAQGVYCDTHDCDHRLRVCNARTRAGVLQVRIVGGGWVVPTRVFQV